jgi:hypothetical protein
MSHNQGLSGIVAPANPNVEGAGSGMNAGSCYPGIGVATTELNPGAYPQVEIAAMTNQPIGWGGDSVVTGQETANIPESKAVDYDNGDFNNTPVGLYEATAIAAPGAVYDTVSGAINGSNQTTAIGDFLWGAVPVA